MKVLVYGFGNIGRQDDAQGVLLVGALEPLKLKHVTLDSNFQLNAEDALQVADHDLVIFVDASYTASAPFQIERVEPSNEIAFSTHAMHPCSILSLSQDLYKKNPPTYLLTLPGYSWQMEENLTPQAQKNMAEALEWLQTTLQKSSLSEIEQCLQDRIA